MHAANGERRRRRQEVGGELRRAGWHPAIDDSDRGREEAIARMVIILSPSNQIEFSVRFEVADPKP
uniref:Uncharacterized protein n=1 Tax=Oryza barthii TaxID=65489 RepID=A0A0D3EZR8_9ORYZ